MMIESNSNTEPQTNEQKYIDEIKSKEAEEFNVAMRNPQKLRSCLTTLLASSVKENAKLAELMKDPALALCEDVNEALVLRLTLIAMTGRQDIALKAFNTIREMIEPSETNSKGTKVNIYQQFNDKTKFCEKELAKIVND